MTKGWRCPVCETVYAPSVVECYRCKGGTAPHLILCPQCQHACGNEVDYTRRRTVWCQYCGYHEGDEVAGTLPGLAWRPRDPSA